MTAIRFPIIDRQGHSYDNPEELADAVEWLEEDAAYLRAQVDKYRDQAVRQRVAENAEKSARYAQELRDCLTK